MSRCLLIAIRDCILAIASITFVSFIISCVPSWSSISHSDRSLTNVLRANLKSFYHLVWTAIYATCVKCAYFEIRFCNLSFGPSYKFRPDTKCLWGIYIFALRIPSSFELGICVRNYGWAMVLAGPKLSGVLISVLVHLLLKAGLDNLWASGSLARDTWDIYSYILFSATWLIQRGVAVNLGWFPVLATWNMPLWHMIPAFVPIIRWLKQQLLWRYNALGLPSY